MALAKHFFSILGSAALVLGCHGDTDFAIKEAHNFSPSGRVAVSIVGVFKDGFLSPETWDALGPRIAPSLHGASCDTLYTADFVNKDSAVASAVDEYTRSNGVTEPMLAELAPTATGDLLLLFSVSGHSLEDKTYHHDVGSQLPGLAPAVGRQGGGTGNGFGGGFGGGSGAPAAPGFNGRTQQNNGGVRTNGSGSDFEMDALFYSVTEKRIVSVMSMRYTGPHEDEGIQRFADKLRAYAPNATCVGFKPDVKLDEQRLRAIPAEE